MSGYLDPSTTDYPGRHMVSGGSDKGPVVFNGGSRERRWKCGKDHQGSSAWRNVPSQIPINRMNTGEETLTTPRSRQTHHSCITMNSTHCTKYRGQIFTLSPALGLLLVQAYTTLLWDSTASDLVPGCVGRSHWSYLYPRRSGKVGGKSRNLRSPLSPHPEAFLPCIS